MAVTETPTDDLAAPPATTVAGYMGCPSLDLHDAMVQMLAVKHATDAELAKMAAAAQARDLHSADGATGMGPWLSMVGGLTNANAQAYVTVGRALANLPHLSKAFSEGRLSLDQVRPAVRFVTPETDEEMAGRLPGWSARQIEEAAREARVRTPRDANEAHENRNLRCVDDDDAGGGHIHAFLPAEQYATVRSELLRRAEQAGPNPETGMWEPLGARLADALFDIAQQAGADRDPQDPAVVVHVDAEVADGVSAPNMLAGARIFTSELNPQPPRTVNAPWSCGQASCRTTLGSTPQNSPPPPPREVDQLAWATATLDPQVALTGTRP
jgi:hypothetical protein